MKKRRRGPVAKPGREVRRGSVIGFQVSEKDREMVERRAKANDMPVSEYLRYAVMCEGVQGGDQEVIALMGLRGGASLTRLLKLIIADREQAEARERERLGLPPDDDEFWSP